MLKQKGPRDFLKYAMADNFRILQELTGTDEYPSTRSLPPIIFGAQYGPPTMLLFLHILRTGWS